MIHGRYKLFAYFVVVWCEVDVKTTSVECFLHDQIILSALKAQMLVNLWGFVYRNIDSCWEKYNTRSIYIRSYHNFFIYFKTEVFLHTFCYVIRRIKATSYNSTKSCNSCYRSVAYERLNSTVLGIKLKHKRKT